jgi:hypothetical protein
VAQTSKIDLDTYFRPLTAFLQKVPSITGKIGTERQEDGIWAVKFSIDIDDELAWHAVQELGHVLNYLSLEERLPTAFMPVSPPPYMNGGPEDYLSWVIECRDKGFSPKKITEWLESRLPTPVNDRDQWEHDEEDEGEERDKEEKED